MFSFRLQHEDGTPADPPTLKAAVPNWSPGDTIPLRARTLRVVEVRDDDADQAPVLVVEETGFELRNRGRDGYDAGGDTTESIMT